MNYVTEQIGKYALFEINGGKKTYTRIINNYLNNESNVRKYFTNVRFLLNFIQICIRTLGENCVGTYRNYLGTKPKTVF